MYKVKLKKFLERHPYAEKVYEIKKPHPSINYNRPIAVWHVSMLYKGEDKEIFAISDYEQIILNSIRFPCEVNRDDAIEIGKDMVQELLDNSDLSELECDGVPCGKEYKKCEDCPDYRYNIAEENWDKFEGTLCMGAMYSIPTHMNSWEDTEAKWNPIYGEKSDNHIKYILDKIMNQIRELSFICEDKDNRIKIAKKLNNKTAPHSPTS